MGFGECQRWLLRYWSTASSAGCLKVEETDITQLISLDKEMWRLEVFPDAEIVLRASNFVRLSVQASPRRDGGPSSYGRASSARLNWIAISEYNAVKFSVKNVPLLECAGQLS